MHGAVETSNKAYGPLRCSVSILHCSHRKTKAGRTLRNNVYVGVGLAALAADAAPNEVVIPFARAEAFGDDKCLLREPGLPERLPPDPEPGDPAASSMVRAQLVLTTMRMSVAQMATLTYGQNHGRLKNK